VVASLKFCVLGVFRGSQGDAVGVEAILRAGRFFVRIPTSKPAPIQWVPWFFSVGKEAGV